MPLRYTHESDFRQERNFGQKISATFEFIGAHWRPLGRVLLYLVAPLALFQGILTALVQSRMVSTMLHTTRYQPGYNPRDPLATQRLLFGAIFQNPLYYVTLAASMVFVSVFILTIYGYLVLCLRPAGAAPTPITPAEVWAVVKRHLLGSFFSLWGLAIIVILGFFFFFLPGYYLSVALSLFFIVRVVEGTGFFATISRCLSLTKGKWWSTFGLIITMIGLLYVLMFGVSMVFNLLRLGVPSTFVPTVEPGQVSAIFVVALTIFFTVVAFLIYPPILLALAFQYFNLVERREAVGLSHLVSQLGQAPAASPDGTTYRPHEEGEY
jgi:hypothetical protein